MTVYVVQNQMRYDHDLREMTPRFPTIEVARQWGELEYILDPSASAFEPDQVIGNIHHKLSGFSDDDFLVLVGNPGLIGMVFGIAAYYNDGKVKILQWSGKFKTYVVISSKIF